MKSFADLISFYLGEKQMDRDFGNDPVCSFTRYIPFPLILNNGAINSKG